MNRTLSNAMTCALLALLLCQAAPAAGSAPTRTDFGGGKDIATDGALDARGNAIVVGTSDPRGPGGEGLRSLSIARYTPTGSLDPTFDGDGTLQLKPAGGLARVQRPAFVAMDSAGRILFATNTLRADLREGFVVGRLLADGSLDRSFGRGGLVRMGSGDSEAKGLAVDDRDRVLLVDETGYAVPSALRLRPDGRLDEAFGAKAARTVRRSLDSVQAIGIDPSGRIVVAGARRNHACVARLLGSGRLDHRFGGDGRSELFTGSNSRFGAVAIDGGGEVVLAGSADARTVVARLRASGGPDRTFAGDGTRALAATGRANAAAIRLTRPGRLLLGTGRSLVGISRKGSLRGSSGSHGVSPIDLEVAALLPAGRGRTLAVGTDDEDFAASIVRP